MKKKYVKFLLACALIFTSNCVITNPQTGETTVVDPFSDITASPTPSRTGTTDSSAAPDPTAVPQTAVPTPIAVPQGGIIQFTGKTVDWQTLGSAEKARFKVQDFNGNRLVYVENPNDPEGSGEFELKWTEPEKTDYSVNETINMSISTKNLVIPENQNVSSYLSITATGDFFDISPKEGSVAQAVGWVGASPVEGTKQISFRPAGLNRDNWKNNDEIKIIISIAHGPFIYYNYRVIK
jgi:hypothetical protein